MFIKKVRVEERVSLLSTTVVTVAEHLVPVMQAIAGTAQIVVLSEEDGLLEDEEGNTDFDLAVVWAGMMERPRMVKQGDGLIPAPLAAYPRGLQDLRDFFERVHGDDAVPAVKKAAPKKPKADKHAIFTDEQKALRGKLTELGIEHDGRASEAKLQALLDSVENEAA